MSDDAHILVVDDDARLRGLLSRYLADQGFRVTTAADAADARDKLRFVHPDLMVLDVMMPGEGGLTFTAALRGDLGDTLPVRLPSGAVRQGTVYYRSVDADYATQRDVSRTKRDIKTFEIRLRCDNSDRSLAVGMTAYVTLPLKNP